MDRYPYFLYPAVCELRRNPENAPQNARLREFIAANVGERDALLRLIGSLDSELTNFYPAAPAPADSIDDTIDSFISRFGKGAEAIVPPPLLDPQPVAEEVTPESPADAMEKVKFLVKNHDYDGAIAIMESFFLNNPKKSVYFADQIRFLRKLKLNESKK